jgi:hypothetical protein
MYLNQDSRIYLTWSGPLQDVDLEKARDYEGINRINNGYYGRSQAVQTFTTA